MNIAPGSADPRSERRLRHVTHLHTPRDPADNQNRIRSQGEAGVTHDAPTYRNVGGVDWGLWERLLSEFIMPASADPGLVLLFSKRLFKVQVPASLKHRGDFHQDVENSVFVLLKFLN